MVDLYWRRQKSFGDLCDAIAGDRAFFMTGAGISRDLRQSKDRTQPLPSWYELLNALEANFGDCLDRETSKELEGLIFPEAAGRYLIEAASIIKRAVDLKYPGQGRFERFGVLSTRPVLGQKTRTHKIIARIAERGIVTFNYDKGHENAFMPSVVGKDRPPLKTIVPSAEDFEESEREIRGLLSGDRLESVLIKAHGCISSEDSIVLTRETYREMMARRPAYRTLLTNIFLNYNVISVGFGMNDPDYNELVESIYNSFGASPRPHFLITKELKQTKGRVGRNTSISNKVREKIDAHLLREEKAYRSLLRNRYNIAEVTCRDWADLPDLLEDSVRHCGPRTKKMIDLSLSPTMADRDAAHDAFSQLSVVGAETVIGGLIERYGRSRATRFAQSEVCYSLGVVRPRRPKLVRPFLKDVIDNNPEVRVVSLALLSFVDYLQKDDLRYFKKRLVRETAAPLKSRGQDRALDGRVVTYLEYLIARTNAKYYSSVS